MCLGLSAVFSDAISISDDYLPKETHYDMGAEMYSTLPTAQTTVAIESIFCLEGHQADINGAIMAISGFPSQTEDIDQLLMSAIVLILAIWSSFFGVLEGNSKIATVAPFIFTLCIPSPKISPIAPTVLAVEGGAIRFRCSSSCNSSFSVFRLRLYNLTFLVFFSTYKPCSRLSRESLAGIL